MSDLPRPIDLAVVGAGPAGLSGAVTAADAGCRVAVLDLGARPGGQYWRHGDASLGPRDPGRASRTGGRSPRCVSASTRIAGPDRSSTCPSMRCGSCSATRRGFIVRATARRARRGAADARCARACSWPPARTTGTCRSRAGPCPGVMAVGGAQAMLKGSHIAPGRRVVVAGTGPFLLPVADGLLRRGRRGRRPSSRRASPAPTRAGCALWPRCREKLPKAAGYGARSPATGFRISPATRWSRAARPGPRRSGHRRGGRSRLARPAPGTERRFACDTLAVGYGFVAQLELLLDARLRHCGWTAGGSARGRRPMTRQRTSVPGVYAAGEPTGVGGADLAVAEGALAGAAIAASARRGPAASTSAAGARARACSAGGCAPSRGALDAAHPVPDGWTAAGLSRRHASLPLRGGHRRRGERRGRARGARRAGGEAAGAARDGLVPGADLRHRRSPR